VRRRLRGEKRGSFALKGSNWFRRPEELSHKAWQADLELLASEHRLLREAAADYLAGKTRPIPAWHIFGVAFHDVYHAGQIRLIRRLQAEKKG